MPHEPFYLRVLKFEFGANRLRIKFCTQKSNSFFKKKVGVVPRKAAKLEKVVWNWKKRPLAPIAAKPRSSGT